MTTKKVVVDISFCDGFRINNFHIFDKYDDCSDKLVIFSDKRLNG